MVKVLPVGLDDSQFSSFTFCCFQKKNDKALSEFNLGFTDLQDSCIKCFKDFESDIISRWCLAKKCRDSFLGLVQKCLICGTCLIDWKDLKAVSTESDSSNLLQKYYFKALHSRHPHTHTHDSKHTLHCIDFN